MFRWLALGLWYASILFTSSLASVPVTNQPLSDYLIAKSGHVVVYGVLGWIAMVAVTEPSAGLSLGRRTALITTVILGLILASMDETRQMFVYGRTSTLTDVVIDTLAMSGSALLHHALTRRAGSPPLPEAPGDPRQQRTVER
jgi:VanZ family protein